MNRRAIGALVMRDLRVVARSRLVLIPLITVPVILLVVLPGLAALAPSLFGPEELRELQGLLDKMPPALIAPFAGQSPEQQLVLLILGYLFAPLYLIVPVMVASVIAADSFAGERERRTLEALLYTPTTDAELVLGKMLAPWLAAVAVAWGGFAAYAVVANVAAWPIMGRIFFPTALWWLLVLWVAPAVAALGLGVTVLVSARVQTFQEAYQLGGVVVLPLVLLIVGQATGVLFLSPEVVLALGAGVWLLNAVLLRVAIRSFRRGEILARS
ncbi:MAG TPA: ABC transporter permease subunit [Longimicrobiaceae bacterium]|nr:ABC transporter permease subunit [Longimicrobiaceae bacterium]